MGRSDNDSWSITESVGATALMVATGRALETRRPQPLASDPFAEIFVRAAGDGFWAKALDGEVRLDSLPQSQFSDRIRDHMAVRTRFFDDFFAEAASEGVRQIVILAAGLDSRAWRLDWPDGTAVYELDQPQVLDFKTRTLAGHEPKARYAPISVDLRDDWPAALAGAGFDAARPTAWLAEGLLAYLPARTQDLLFERIAALSAPGSRVGVNTRIGGSYAAERPVWQKAREELAAQGLDLNMQDLIYSEDRDDPADWLAARGWQTSSHTDEELLDQAGRPHPAGDEDQLPRIQYIRAALRGETD
ncbi:MAG: class I SAM-dependent methyltransferase [Segniliparus sp.]|uniref:class I SAM-dependent methyltransferase n=1 Tax=Segniliparus sp. TaxID=2804064 RepID=UPI003F336BB4